ncbi:hypothetical protein ACWDKQ_18925 [Saccharopolyspora sp. NPDC000995]
MAPGVRGGRGARLDLKSAKLADLQDQLSATCPPDTDTYEAVVQRLRNNDHHEIDIRYYTWRRCS